MEQYPPRMMSLLCFYRLLAECSPLHRCYEWYLLEHWTQEADAVYAVKSPLLPDPREMWILDDQNN